MTYTIEDKSMTGKGPFDVYGAYGMFSFLLATFDTEEQAEAYVEYLKAKEMQNETEKMEKMLDEVQKSIEEALKSWGALSVEQIDRFYDLAAKAKAAAEHEGLRP